MNNAFETLVKLAARLRAPDGCPWDREQTYESLKKCVLDEAQEIAEAIDKNDIPNLEEEIGDVLFNLILLAQIGEERGDFSLESLCQKTEAKLIERHTWIFGSDKVSNAEEALALWKKNKAKKS